MGTQVTVEVWHEDAQIAEKGIQSVMDDMRRIDRLMSPYRQDSQVSLINRQAAKAPVRCDPELFHLIARSLDISKMTGGAFDISFASVGYLYDYRQRLHPDSAQLESSLPAVNYRHIRLDSDTQSIRFLREGVRIDLGGIAKGYAVDHGLQILAELGIDHALVTAGGDSRVRGERWGRPWTIGIRAPRDPAGIVAMIPLIDTAISTSGDYERFFVEDGIRYHHILDPATGRSADAVRSVSIIGPDATTTDALSTSVFVMGPAKGLALINTLPDIEAVIIDNTGGMHLSVGLKQMDKSAQD